MVRPGPLTLASYIAWSDSAEELVGVGVHPGRHVGDADREADVELLAPVGDRILDELVQPLGDALGDVGRVADALAQHDELVAAEAGDDVAVAHRSAQAVRDLHEHLVAALVAAAVVHRLEPVEVAEQHRERVRRARVARDRAVQLRAERGAVGQAGERIVGGHVAELVLDRGEPALRLDLLGDVLDRGDHALGPVARRVELRDHPQAEPPRALVAERGGDRRGRLAAETGSERGLELAAVLGAGEGQPVGVAERLQVGTEERLGRRVPVHDLSGGIGDQDADGRRLGEREELRVGLAERGGEGAALVEVAHLHEVAVAAPRARCGSTP